MRLRVLVWDDSGSRQLRCGTGDLVIVAPGDVTTSPARIVSAIRRDLGLETALLRVAPAALGAVELPARAAYLPPGCRWVAPPLEPPTPQRTAWPRPAL